MAIITARAKKSLARPQPWDRTKWPTSTPPGWQLDSNGSTWQVPPNNWRFNGSFWFLVPDCEAFLKGSCAKGNKCKRLHPTTTKSSRSATGSLGNSSTETLIIENVTPPDVKEEPTVEIKSISIAESRADAPDGNTEGRKTDSTVTTKKVNEEKDVDQPNQDEAKAQQETPPEVQQNASLGTQKEAPAEEIARQEDFLAKLRTIDGFSTLADHIAKPQVLDSTSSATNTVPSCRALDLILLSKTPFKYTDGIKIYYQWLIWKALLPKESTFLDLSGPEDCCLYDVQNLNDQQDTCHHGLVLINQPMELCQFGRSALLRLREAHPGLVIVLVVPGKSIPESFQPIAARFPTTVRLLSTRKYERLRNIRELLLASLQAKYKGKMKLHGGSDGDLIFRYAQNLHKACQRNYDDDNMQEKIHFSLDETCKRHIERFLESDDIVGDGDLFTLGANDVFPQKEMLEAINDEAENKSKSDTVLKKSEEQEVEEFRTQFQPLQNHITTKVPQLAKLANREHGSLMVNWQQLNLRLTRGRSGPSGDYFHAGKFYFRALRDSGFFSKDPKHLIVWVKSESSSECGCDGPDEMEEEEETEKQDDEDDSKSDDQNTDDENNQDDEDSDDEVDAPNQNVSDKKEEPQKQAKRLNCVTKVVGDATEGLLFIDRAEFLCKAGAAAVRTLHKERPKIFLAMEIRMWRAEDENKQLAEDLCPYVVDIGPDKATELNREVSKAFFESLKKKYEGHMKFEGGEDGLLVQTCIRRIVKKCKTDYEDENIKKEVDMYLSDIYERHLQRHMECTRDDANIDFMLLTCTDLLGKEPDVTQYETDEWKELNKMVGMEMVKASIQALFDGLLLNYHREIQNKKPLEVGLSKIFLGPPGTGKTTVAKLYGKMLKAFGFLSNGDLLVRNASDFIARYIGESAHQTKKILKNAQGNVLLIDEAYMLDAVRDSGCSPCPFRQEAVDTLVGEVQNKPGDDICIILCGYKTEMENFVRNANPGFRRRFPLADAFIFQEFTEQQLSGILDLKMEAQSLSTTPEGRATALDVLKLAKQCPNFGNGGEVDNILSRAMLNFQRRFGSTIAPKDRFQAAKNSVLLPQDFDPSYNRIQGADEKVSAEINMIGMETQKGIFAQLSAQAKAMRKFGRDPKPYMPFTLVFKGPPGTGKTSFARHIGRIYYEMGILATADVVEASTTDMIAGWVGQTAPKTRNLLEGALGKVLLIDEAYRLGGAEDGRNSFAKEARDELVDCLTKPEFARKLVIVLAGYTRETEAMLGKNPGLSSRFPMHLDFEPLPSGSCLGLLKKRIEEADVAADFDTDDAEVLSCLDKLRAREQWSNGRDVETMAEEMVRKSFEASAAVIEVDGDEDLPIPTVTKELVLEVMGKRLPRAASVKKNASFDIRNFPVPPRLKAIAEK